MSEIILLLVLILLIYYFRQNENFIWEIAKKYSDPAAAHWGINQSINGWTPYDIMLSPFPVVIKPNIADPPQFYNLNSLDSNLISSGR